MKLDLKIDLSDKRVISGITVVVLVLAIMCFWQKKSATPPPTTVIKNTKKLTPPSAPNTDGQVKMVMYGRDSCPWCAKQKKEMGDEMKNVKYVSCEESPDECRKASVSALPTWVINGKKFEGFMPKDQVLAKLN